MKPRRPCGAVLLGVLLGFTVSSWLLAPRGLEGTAGKPPACTRRHGGSTVRNAPAAAAAKDPDGREEDRVFGNGSGDTGRPAGRPKRFLYVGVMTAKKYVRSRAVAAYRTWVSSIPGKVEFFSSEGTGAVRGPVPVPVVSLPDVDDSYPPQKKSFMMLKYMHDHHLDEYEWFMRADDDAYIRGDLCHILIHILIYM
ncbi:Chondroitin sulfate synthase 1 [Liparis tanakae]|uniref:Chondroitin sulfate synthase 1 n=1 Tax=Liparis tanakae TaxID=230148 RepID=A0A4Z2EIU8_9TELE|nr:Chondroitin sulfate synthase 1 [Liparis tanakae]